MRQIPRSREGVSCREERFRRPGVNLPSKGLDLFLLIVSEPEQKPTGVPNKHARPQD